MRVFRLARLSCMVLSCMAATACTPTGATEPTDTADEAVGVPEVTQPAIRQSPFCEQMLELDAALPNDPAVDTREQVLEAYRAALSDVPADIDAEFRAVIGALETGSRATVAGNEAELDAEELDGLNDPAATLPLDATVPPVPTGPTTLPSEEQLVAEEGRLPDDEPAARVNAYIDFACRGTTNNPGPPATEPGVVLPTSEDG